MFDMKKKKKKKKKKREKRQIHVETSGHYCKIQNLIEET